MSHEALMFGSHENITYAHNWLKLLTKDNKLLNTSLRVSSGTAQELVLLCSYFISLNYLESEVNRMLMKLLGKGTKYSPKGDKDEQKVK